MDEAVGGPCRADLSSELGGDYGKIRLDAVGEVVVRGSDSADAKDIAEGIF